LPNVIKIDPYNFQLWRFKLGAFFLTHSVYTFFGDTPTGQTPRRIFTRDGSNDAVSGKGVPFGG